MEETKNKMKNVLSLLVVLMALVSTLGLVLPGGASPALADGTQPSLVARWSFNEGNGSTAHDMTGNGNDGTIYGATWVANPSLLFGSALSFDGINDYVIVADSPSLEITGNITVEGWIYLTSISQEATVAAKWKDIGMNQRGYLLTVGADLTPRFYVSTNGGNYPKAVGSPLSLNKWYHLAGTYDGANIKLYVGTAPVTLSQTGNIFNNSQPLLIGATDGYGYSGRRFTNGSIDEVRVWNGVLSASQLDDMLPPVITVDGVSDISLFTLGQSVTATWSVLDGTGSGAGSGVTGVASYSATNDGVPITSGSALSTGTAGPHTLVIIATDLAHNTATITVTYTVMPPSITITAPSPIAFGNFSRTNVKSSTTNGTVTVTGAFNIWSVQAVCVAPSAGYMMNGSTPLTDPLYISSTNGSWTLASTGINYGPSTSNPGNLPLWSSQTIERTDAGVGDYTVIITFTGSLTY